MRYLFPFGFEGGPERPSFNHQKVGCSLPIRMATIPLALTGSIRSTVAKGWHNEPRMCIKSSVSVLGTGYFHFGIASSSFEIGIISLPSFPRPRSTNSMRPLCYKKHGREGKNQRGARVSGIPNSLPSRSCPARFSFATKTSPIVESQIFARTTQAPEKKL